MKYILFLSLFFFSSVAVFAQTASNRVKYKIVAIDTKIEFDSMANEEGYIEILDSTIVLSSVKNGKEEDFAHLSIINRSNNVLECMDNEGTKMTFEIKEQTGVVQGIKYETMILMKAMETVYLYVRKI